jgi:hypothetical protein
MPHDYEHDLNTLAARIEGASLLQIENTADGHGRAAITDRTGRRWRVTFDGGVDAYWLPDYRLIPEEQVAGAEIADVLWDDQWLIAARLRGADIHVRLFGEPVSVEEIES